LTVLSKSILQSRFLLYSAVPQYGTPIYSVVTRFEWQLKVKFKIKVYIEACSVYAVQFRCPKITSFSSVPAIVFFNHRR